MSLGLAIKIGGSQIWELGERESGNKKSRNHTIIMIRRIVLLSSVYSFFFASCEIKVSSSLNIYIFDTLD